jgi:putative transposase
MKKTNQFSFFNHKIQRQFGGFLHKGNPKTSRPLSTKEPLHLVLKSNQAIGAKSMLRSHNVKKIEQIIKRHAKLCRVRLYHLVNVGNHLHLVIKIDCRRDFSKFIRTITGLIARHVLKKERGVASQNEFHHNSSLSKTGLQFWAARPFSRLISWGKDYLFVSRYMKKNIAQAKQFFASWGFEIVDPYLIQTLSTT